MHAALEEMSGQKIGGNRIRAHVALAPRVLAVAVFNLSVGDWAAYIDAVPGENHEEEIPTVSRNGTKLPEHIAHLLFFRAVNALNEEREEKHLPRMRWRR